MDIYLRWECAFICNAFSRGWRKLRTCHCKQLAGAHTVSKYGIEGHAAVLHVVLRSETRSPRPSGCEGDLLTLPDAPGGFRNNRKTRKTYTALSSLRCAHDFWEWHLNFGVVAAITNLRRTGCRCLHAAKPVPIYKDQSQAAPAQTASAACTVHRSTKDRVNDIAANLALAYS
eukprot:6192296-Pleurochrysis_carterae.AAC.2